MLRTRLNTLIAVWIVMPIGLTAQSADDRYPFVKNGKVGFIDSEGREVIPAQFGNVGDMAHFREGLAPVAGAEGAGYIDSSGRFVIGPQRAWGAARPFHEGVAGVLLSGKHGESSMPAWIDRSGSVLFTNRGSEGSYFSEGLMPMAVESKCGFVDRTFNLVIEPQFDLAFGFSEGFAAVQIGRKWGFIDRSGKIVIPPQYDYVSQFSEGLGRVRFDIPSGKEMTVEGPQTVFRFQYGFVDRDGNEVIPPQFEQATQFSEGYALASPPDSNKLGIINKQGKFVHDPEFQEGSEFHEGLAAVKVSGKWGYVDSTGSWVIPPVLSYAQDFQRGLARVGWNDGVEYGYINKKGKAVWKNNSDKAGTGSSAP